MCAREAFKVKKSKVVNEMTEQQERFCKIYVDYNCDRGKRADAYIEAGFKTQTRKAASNCAGRLLENDVIKQKIQQLQKEKFAALRERIENEEERKIMGVIEKRALLAELMNDPYISTQDRLRALDIDNKMEGLYIVKNQISGADGGALSVKWEVAESGGSYNAQDNNSI